MVLMFPPLQSVSARMRESFEKDKYTITRVFTPENRVTRRETALCTRSSDKPLSHIGEPNQVASPGFNLCTICMLHNLRRVDGLRVARSGKRTT